MTQLLERPDLDAQAHAPAAEAGGALLAARGITKRFPGVLAIDAVDIEVRAGEVVALLGQNGAGKSTLIQVLAGVHAHGSHEGSIALAGKSFAPRSVAEAERAGIALVPQEINVVPELSVAQNLFLQSEPARAGFVDRPLLAAQAKRVLHEFGLALDADTRMGALDLATQQLVIIARALSKQARILILDEPTAALTHHEAQRLFARVRGLCARGVGVIFVSHRLAEVFEIADRIVVMRDGRVCARSAVAETTRDAVVAQMIGKKLQTGPQGARRALGKPALSVKQLVVQTRQGRPCVQGLDLELGQGEIVGLFGLMGAGCIEAALALYGAWSGPVSGDLRVDGAPVAIASPAQAIAHGIGLMAQDRRDSLVPEHSVLANALLADLPRWSPNGMVDWPGFRRQARTLATRLAIKAPTLDTPVGSLSGGNQQKVQIARWLASPVRILLLVDPTRGVDVAARAEISQVWRELAAAGYALLLVSTDAEEIVELCDRALVLRSGLQVAEFEADALSEEGLLRAAAGV